MIQGTMSNVGKSLIVAGLCRIYARRGYSVAPFKSQNMALNAAVTIENLEIGRAQAMQAEAAGIPAEAAMNPILLKPTGESASEVIVNGESTGVMPAMEYFRRKKTLKPVIREAYGNLSAKHDIIVIEGAGSPAEINLNRDDIVNMGIAAMFDAPVILAGDIDRGGVFAQLIGTLMLLDEEDRKRVRGLLVNKFRGDRELFRPGERMIEERTGLPVLGVIPYCPLGISDEDSLAERLRPTPLSERKAIDIAVVKYPRISNFTDFDVFDQFDQVSVRFVERPEEVGRPELLVLPGSKHTIADLRWLRESRMDEAVERVIQSDGLIFGICGGYQMLGKSIEDETLGCRERGLGLLNLDTVIGPAKRTECFSGRFETISGAFAGLSGLEIEGYEIHMGVSAASEGVKEFTSGETGVCGDRVFGTYIHGIFDRGEIAAGIVRALAERKQMAVPTAGVRDAGQVRRERYDKLADLLEESMNIREIDRILGI